MDKKQLRQRTRVWNEQGKYSGRVNESKRRGELEKRKNRDDARESVKSEILTHGIIIRYCARDMPVSSVSYSLIMFLEWGASTSRNYPTLTRN